MTFFPSMGAIAPIIIPTNASTLKRGSTDDATESVADRNVSGPLVNDKARLTTLHDLVEHDGQNCDLHCLQDLPTIAGSEYRGIENERRELQHLLAER